MAPAQGILLFRHSFVINVKDILFGWRMRNLLQSYLQSSLFISFIPGRHRSSYPLFSFIVIATISSVANLEQKSNFWVVVVAQLVERLLATAEVCSSNPVIGNIYIEHELSTTVLKRRK